MFNIEGQDGPPPPAGSPPSAPCRPGWPDLAHGSRVLRCWLLCAGSCLLLAGAAAGLGATGPGARAWALPLVRELLSWGFVPFAAGTLAIWRRTAAPMAVRLRERLYLTAALGAAAVLAAVGADLLVGQIFAPLTLSVSVALTLGMGLLAPILAFALWPR